MKKFLIIALTMFLIGCTDSDNATSVLQAQGFTQIEITGYRFTGCGDDTFHTGFTAKGVNGQYISGVVCSGWFKGATIRYD